MAPTAYLYDETTLKYQNETTCQLDPLESEKAGKEIYLQPGNSTFTKPLEEKEGFDIVYVKESDNWEYQEKKKDPEPEPYVPTEEDKKAQNRSLRNYYLTETDHTRLDDVPYTDEEKEFYKEYRQYLRDYTETEEWWETEPMKFEDWLVAFHPVVSE